MSPLKASLLLGLLSGVVTVGGLFYVHQGRTRELRTLQSQNNRMRLEAYQRNLGRSVGSPSAAPSSISDAEPAARTAAEVAPVAKMTEFYRNEGNATPLATLQTFAWACDRGEIETVGRLLYVEEAARPKVEAFVASLPESVRKQWKSVDETVAALLTESVMARPFPRADFLETATPEEVAPGRIRLRMPNVPRDGTEYQQTAEGWKYVLTEKVVDAYINQVRSQAGKAR
ncbi:MAG TPA: hypothetical protein VHN79_00515 [Lacunisphaera sp.]|nr:hypothetical protein [Lacunisphaera sp.]